MSSVVGMTVQRTWLWQLVSLSGARPAALRPKQTREWMPWIGRGSCAEQQQAEVLWCALHYTEWTSCMCEVKCGAFVMPFLRAERATKNFLTPYLTF